MVARKKAGYLFALLGGICWALAGVFGQYLFQEHDLRPQWLVPVRLIGAGIVLMIICKLRGQRVLHIFENRRDAKDIVIFAVVGAALCQYAYFAAVAASNAATATFISYTSPVFIIVMTIMRTKQMPVRSEVVSCLLVITGIFIVSTHGSIYSLHISGAALFWATLSALAFAIYSIQSQRLMRKFNTLLITAWGMLLGGVLLFITCRPWTLKGVSSIDAYAALVVIIVLGTILSYVLFLKAIQTIGPTKGSLLSSIEPVAATVLSIIWLKDKFQLIDLLGFLLIFATVVILASAKQPDSKVLMKRLKKDKLA